jgi:hypothetical protein
MADVRLRRYMGSRKYITGVVAVALLIWGPLDHSWPAWLAIRTAYLILVPLATWFLLGWIWRRWQPDSETETRLQRSLAGATAGILLVFAIMEAMSDTHIGNTMWVSDGHGGREAVGDNIVLPGPDWGQVLMLTAASGFAFWLSIAKGKPNPEE